MSTRAPGRILFAFAALAIAGCGRLSATGDSSGGGGSGGPAWASNGGDVGRFQDEVPYGVNAVVAHDNTAIRKSPGTGTILATLPAGANVLKISWHGKDDLVTFDDPKSAGQRLMGWVPEASLDEPAAPPAPENNGGDTVSDAAATPVAPLDPTPTPSSSPGPEPRPHHHHGHPHPQNAP